MEVDVAIRPDHQQARPSDAPRHAFEQLRRRFVGPVQILQHDQHRLNRCGALEEVAHALEHVVTGLVGGQRQRRRQVRIGDTHLGHEPGDLGARVAHRRPEYILSRDGQSVLDGFHEGDVGQRALHVVTMPPDDEHAGCLRLGRDLVDQPRLSKASLSRDERNASASGHGAGQRLTQQGPLLRPPDVRRAAATGRNAGGGELATGSASGRQVTSHSRHRSGKPFSWTRL